MAENIKIIRVNSSCLSAVCYDGQRKILAILTTKGRAYNYLAVPAHIYHGLLQSDSIGKFYNKEIAGIYESVAIDGSIFRADTINPNSLNVRV